MIDPDKSGNVKQQVLLWIDYRFSQGGGENGDCCGGVTVENCG